MANPGLSSPRRHRSKTWTAAAIAVLLLAAGLRFYRLDSQSLWADEGNSAALSARSLAVIARDAAADIHPPLYYWLLHAWTGLFGRSEIALRSLSVVLSIGLVALIFGLGRQLSGIFVGLAAAIVAALSPFQIYYAQEARMYTLAAFLAAGTMYALVAFTRTSIPPLSLKFLPPCFLYILGATAGLYTHYAFPVMLLVTNVLFGLWWLAMWRKPGRWLRAGIWTGMQVIVLILYLPWLPTGVSRVTAWPGVVQPYDLGQAWLTAWRWLSLGSTVGSEAEPWLVGFAILACLGLFSWRGRTTSPPAWWTALALFSWLLAPLVLMTALHLFKEAYLKFLLIGSPAFCLLVGQAITGPWRESGKRPFSIPATIVFLWPVATLVFVAVACVTPLRLYFDPAYARDDYRGMARYIAATANPDDAILLNAPGQLDVFSYYYNGPLAIYALPHQRPLDEAQTLAELQVLLRHPHLYALYWATDESDPRRVIETWLDTHAYKAMDVWRGHVRFVIYATPQEQPGTPIPVGVRLGQGIWLRSWTGGNLAPAAGDIITLKLFWEAEQPLSTEPRFKVTVQALNAADQVVAQRDSEPVSGSRPTISWRPGEVITDSYGVFIPFGTPPGTYRLIVGLYDPRTGERLRTEAGADHVLLTQIKVQRSQVPPPLEVLGFQQPGHLANEDVALVGYSQYKRGFGHAPETPLKPGDFLHLDLYWQALRAPQADWWLTVSLRDRANREWTTLSAPLAGGGYPTSEWSAGEIVRGQHDLVLPVNLPPDRYRLILSLRLAPDAPSVAETILGEVSIGL